MVLLNFSHPLTPAQVARAEELMGAKAERLIEQMPQFDHDRPMGDQVREVVDSAGLSPAEWQTAPLLINLPGFAPAAATLLAELHGRMGYFPSVLRLRPMTDSTLRQFEVAEVIDLQAVREEARSQR
jgi:hypothetical protein